jgi:hypothetical protein
MPIEHWMMFGTFGEQRHFIYPSKQTYQGVIINGNMVAHAPDGLAAFLLEKTANQRYIIDPLTHAFQHSPSFLINTEGNLKSSIETLANIYGEPFQSIVGKRPALPKDFKDDAVLSALVNKCLDFQDSRLASSMAKSDVMKYFFDPDMGAPSQPVGAPYALVAPYFYITETSVDEWLPVCVRAARMARQLYPDRRLFVSVVVSQGAILDRSVSEEIANAFNAEDISGYLLWVDNLDEQQAGEAELRGLLALARLLRGDGRREVINLHGGYFSILAAGTLGNSAMSGVTHGPEFGEFRSVVPVGGGIPIARYYLRHLHTRVRYKNALAMLTAKGWLRDAATFHANVCDCDECRATINGDAGNFTLFGKGNVKEVKRGSGIVRLEYPTGETKQRCLRHYLQRKSIEYQFAATASRDQLIADLDDGYNAFEEIVGLDGVGHLKRWKKLLA